MSDNREWLPNPLCRLGPAREGESAHILWDPTGHRVELVVEAIVDCLPTDGRERYLALLTDIIEKPEEVWLIPLKKADSRAVLFLRKYVKLYQAEGKNVGLVLSTEVRGTNAYFAGFDVVEDINQVRTGFLRYSATDPGYGGVS